MTARIYPVDAVTGAPSYTGRYLRQTAVAPFAGMGSSARPLGAMSGVRPGTPATIVTATSTTWTVTPLLGIIDGEALAIAGPYAYSFDTNQTGSVTAAGASARTDRLDVQVSDPAESDGSSAPSIQIVYTAGTPSLPAAPARSHPLAQINVPATGGGSPTVTWAATYYCAPGGTVPFNTLGGLNAWTTAGSAQLAFVLFDSTPQNNGPYIWDLANTTWRKNGVFAKAAGFATISGAAGSSSTPIFWGGSESVTFPTGRFSVAPIVQAQILNPQGGVEWVTVLGVTTSGFTYRILRAAAAPLAGTTIQWTATQMTPTSADG